MLTQAALLPVERQVHMVPQGTEVDGVQFLFGPEATASAILVGDSREVLKLVS